MTKTADGDIMFMQTEPKIKRKAEGHLAASVFGCLMNGVDAVSLLTFTESPVGFCLSWEQVTIR
ncbi:hypothetical protein BaRGS_00003394, partial [Batillaria attramentaria]